MNAKNHIAGAMVAATTFFSPALAHAACTQASLAGTWRIHMLDEFGFWLACNLNVSSGGDLSASTPCKPKSGSNYTLQPGGKLTMSAPGACTFKGSFVLVNSTSGGNVAEIDDGVLSRNHELGSGVGEFGGDGTTFRFIRR